MNRRTFLAAVPAAVAVPGAVAVPPVTAHSDISASPIMTLFHDYQRLSEAAQQHVCIEDDEDAELERLFYRERDQIVGRICRLPCVCASDFAAKLIVDTCQGMLFSEWDTGDLWREARALVGAPGFMVAS
ncbi:hypothetical protein [Paracoccus aminovorans]|uniref:hypothetical protein n=1 Tax=Paracoccus aminovorans TaxID=34004 RepID=UPI002B25835C|nr:hypothetical protein [Paracoccus aminovorans]